MTRQPLKLYPFHCFLFIPFIVLFLFSHNLGQTKAYMTYRTLVVGTISAAFMFGGFYLVFRNRLKAGVVVTFVLFSLFQYGVIYEFFEQLYYTGKWPLKNIHRYQVSLYLIVYCAFIWKTWRTGHDFIKINYFLNALILILLLFNFARMLFVNYSNIEPQGTDNSDKLSNTKFDSLKPRPDIYFIILDGYASAGVLRKYYNFENKDFMNSMRALNFRFSDSAFANYYYTSSSLAATLNFRYRDSASLDVDLIRNNDLFRVLKNNGYAIWHMKSGYAVTSYFRQADKTVIIDGPNEFEKNLFKYTILRLDDLLGFFAHKRLSSQFEKMSEMATGKGSPKFCFMHFVAPHPPYVFDANGNMRAKHQFAEHSWEPKEFYIEQLVYVNKKITEFIEELVKVNPNAVIIMQSDHGPWIKAATREDVFEARSGILYAYRSGSGFSPPRISSPVNTFRYLFNDLFGCRLDTLPDLYAGKQILMQDPILTKKAEER